MPPNLPDDESLSESVTNDELFRLLGELRRKQDERHKENLGRFKSIESQIAKDREQMNEMTFEMKEAKKIAIETRNGVESLVSLIQASKTIRSSLLWIASILVAVSVIGGAIWAAILFIRGSVVPLH